MAAGRQLAKCSRCLAALTRRSGYQAEDAPAAYLAPSARFFLATRASASTGQAPLSAPSHEQTSSPASQQGLNISDASSSSLDDNREASRSFQSRSMPASTCRFPGPSSGLGAADASQHASTSTHTSLPQKASHLDQPTATAAAAPTASSSSSAGDAAKPSARSRFSLHWRFRPSTGANSVTQSATSLTSPDSSSSSSSSQYSDPKDGSFAGRIVQHDGSHAVHLLVSGTSARDYGLRMVRCHVRDELVFEGGGGGAGGSSAGGAVARREDVAFTTFVYRQIRDTISATFLPAGYPATTGDNYLKFMAWQGVNNIAVTANSVLASTFMLYAVGLGAGSIPTAGALNWVLKDGMGQLGTLLFGKTIAHNFDVHSKTWFFLSAVMLQAAAALELLTVLMPGHFLLMGSLANTLKGLAWMAAGSTRSVFHLSFARDNNIADVTAKGTSQYIFASLVGTAGGAVMCAAVGQSGAAAAGCFSLLAAATLASAYMAVQVIPLATLNATRLQLLVDAFLTSISPQHHAHPQSAAAAPQAAASQHSQASPAASSYYPNRTSVDDDEDEGEREGADSRHHPAHRRTHGHQTHQQQQPQQQGYMSAGSSSSPHATSSGGSGGGGGFRRYGGTGGGVGSGGGGGGGSRSRGGDLRDDEGDEYDFDYYGYGVDGSSSSNSYSSSSSKSRSGGGGGGGWRKQQGRMVDRCYIGPSIHEYDMMYDDSLEPKVPTPLELSPLDPPLPYFSRLAHRLSPPIHVGSRLEHVVDGNANLLVMLLTTYKYTHFMVLPMNGGLHVVLHERADPRDMVQAYLQACILRRRMQSLQGGLPDPEESTAELRLELQESLAAAERLTTVFMSSLEASGWTVCKVVVEAQRRRAKW